MQNNMLLPQNTKNIVTMWPSNPASGYLPEIFENIYSQRYMHPYVHCSITHGEQDVDITKVSVDEWVNKEAMVHVCSGKLHSHKKR